MKTDEDDLSIENVMAAQSSNFIYPQIYRVAFTC